MRFHNLTHEGRSQIRTIGLILIFSFILLCIKFTAYFLTNSNAILTDALESIVNVVAGCFALFSVYYSSRPSDANHPYGHGKVEFLSAGFEGGLIFVAGISIIANSVYTFFQPVILKSLDLGVILSAFAGIVNYLMGKILLSKGKKNESLLMIASGRHLISDTISSIGLVAGLLVIYFTGFYRLDQIIAVIFGAIILKTGYDLLKKSVTSLLDEADYEKLGLIVSELQKHRKEKWIDIHNLRVIRYGTKLHVDCHVTLPWYDSLESAHAEVSSLERLIRESMGEGIEFFIHADPCVMPVSCPICMVSNCPVRKAPFTKKIEWRIDNVLPNVKHGMMSV